MNSVGGLDGNGEVQMQGRRRRIKEQWPRCWTWRRLSSESPFVVGLGNALQLPKEDLASAVRVPRAPEASAVRCVAEPLRTTTANLPGSKWSCLLRRIVLQDASSEVTKNYPPLKLRVFVDDIAAK